MIKKRTRPQPRLWDPFTEANTDEEHIDVQEGEEELPYVFDLFFQPELTLIFLIQDCGSHRAAEVQKGKTRHRCDEIEQRGCQEEKEETG
jgi:hypothetical protein